MFDTLSVVRFLKFFDQSSKVDFVLGSAALECSFATLKRHLGALPKARETTNVEDILEK